MVKRRYSFAVPFVIMSIFIFIFGAEIEKAEAQAFKRVNEGDVAPDFSLKDVDGKEHKLSDYKGKVFGLIFWNNPSLRSAEELKILQDLYLKHKDGLGLSMLAVYVPQSDDEVPAQEIAEMKKVLTESTVSYLNLIDTGMKVFGAYGVITFPSYAVIKEDGRIGVILPGLPTFGGEKLLRKETEKLLGIVEEEKIVKEVYQVKGKADFYYSFANQMYLKGFLDKALNNLEQALQEDPDYYKPYHLQGSIFAAQKKTDLAAAAYNKAMELAPNDINLKMDSAQFYLNNQNKDEALKIYQNIFEHYPDSPDGHYGLGLIFMADKKLEEAQQELVIAKDLFQKQAVLGGNNNINPNRGNVHHQLGLIYTQKGDLDQAFVEFSQACEEFDKLVKKLLPKANK